MDKFEDEEVNDKLQLTVQVVKSGEMKAGDKGGGNTDAFWNVKNTGDSIFGTIRDFTHQSSRKLYWPHNKVIIFGRSLAEDGISEYLDFFVRDQETRLGVWMLVADEQAGDIFEVKPKLEKMPAINLANLLEAQAATSQTAAIKLDDFVTRLISKTTAPFASFVKISGQGSEKSLHVTGTAVFKEDKLIGELNKTETRGLLWVIDDVKSGIIDVECPEDDGKISLEIIRAQSKITPRISEDKVHIEVKIKEEGNIGSQSCSDNLQLPEAVAKLEAENNTIIESEVRAALSKAQKLNADIFGFGDAVHQKFPKEWKELESNWDEIFPDLDVTVTVEGKIRRSGSSKKVVAPEKE
ncbi:Ger(x)C family spore germination protein [Desulfosporosinus burensis]